MKKRKRNLKGTVLFTTVSVMALLILFLLGTLTLASASNNRAHKSYSSSQANYTAKAAIDGFIQAMVKEKAVEAAVIEVGKSGGSDILMPELKFNDTSFGHVGYLDASNNFIEGKICVEKDTTTPQFEYLDDANVAVTDKKASAKWKAVDRVKITATARVGKEYETVVAYLNKLEGTPPIISKTGSPQVKGIQMLGGSVIPAGRMITGGLGVALENNENPETIVNLFRNKVDVETTLTFINSSVIWNTSDTVIDIINPTPEETCTPYSQTVVTGNMWIKNDSSIKVVYDLPGEGKNVGTEANPVKPLSEWTNKDVPYLYVDKCLYFQNKCSLINDNNNPFNLFCGTLFTDGNSKFPGTNIYMMDEVTGGEYSIITEGGTVKRNIGDNRLNLDGSNLEKWASSIANGSKVPASTVGGSIFCNGNLSLKGGTIEGDLRVKGDLTLEENVIVKGNVLVGGTINYNGKKIKQDDTTDKTGVQANLNNSGDPGASILIDKSWSNTEIVNSGSIGEANFTDETDPSTMYKISYIQWKPEDHGNKDIFGNDCTDEPSMVRFYKFKDDLVYFRTVDPNLQNCVENTKSYDELIADGTFIDLQGKIDPSVVYVDSMTRDDRRPANPYDGENTYYYGVPCSFVNDDGTPAKEVTCQPADGSKSYFNYDLSTDVPHKFVTETEKADIIANAPAVGEKQYYRKDYDGNDTADIVLYDKTYYAGPSYYGGTEAEAIQKAKDAAGGGSGASNIYPDDMTRDAIYMKTKTDGSVADPETKIITNITEARSALGLNSDGVVNEKVYKHLYSSTETNTDSVLHPNNVKDNAADEKLDISSYMSTVIDGVSGLENAKSTDVSVEGSAGAQYYSIKSSCMLTGKFDGVSIAQSLSNSSVKELHINPGVGELNIVLNNVTTDGNLKIIVESGGHVNFYVIGKFATTNQQEGVFTSKYLDPGGCNFTYKEDWGINWYGANGSSIKLVNDSTLIGAFKMPYTSFEGEVRGAAAKITYTDEYGNTHTPKNGDDDPYPMIVGNALFKDIDVTNSLVNYYTATGADTVSPDSTETKKSSTGSWWNIKYRAAS